MKIQIHKNVDHASNPAKLAKKIINWICGQLNLKPASLDVIFTSDDELRRIHKQFLKEDHITDVMTFNLSDEIDKIEGEIYISIDAASRQAFQYKVSFDEEISRLIIHGCMHLAGYNDDTEENQKNMKKIEDHYVELAKNQFM